MQTKITRLALWVLSRAMRKDADLAWSWHCNIAMLAQDAGGSHREANIRTAAFIKHVFGVDTNLDKYLGKGWDTKEKE